MAHGSRILAYFHVRGISAWLSTSTDERRYQGLFVSGLASSLVALLIVGVLAVAGSLIEDFVLVYYPFAMALLIYALVVLVVIGLRFVMVDLTREPAWLALWQQCPLTA